MTLDRIPLFQHLEPAKRVLIAGMGGGYDVFSGLPLYFALRNARKSVHLASLSFTNIPAVEGRRLTRTTVEVTADSGGPARYFPEKYLCEWFRLRSEEVSVYCFDPAGVRPLAEGYAAVIDENDIDAVVLGDGGTDSLMRGDEPDLGTPHEDLSSVAAVHSLQLEQSFLACIGFGVDYFHGVDHGCFLENVAALTKQGAFLGAFSLLPAMEEARLHRDVAQFVFDKMPRDVSIVSSSVLSAVQGEYGDYHVSDRTRGSKLWINPLMSMYWTFLLDGVARQCLYLDHIAETMSYHDLNMAIAAFRDGLEEKRERQQIPL